MKEFKYEVVIQVSDDKPLRDVDLERMEREIGDAVLSIPTLFGADEAGTSARLIPSDLVVVPFNDNDHNGRTTGDSSCGPETCVPYLSGMTVEDLQAAWRKEFIVEDGVTEEEVQESGYKDLDDYAKDCGITCTGGWVIERRDFDAINAGSFDVGNDTALYGMLHALKSSIAAAAIKTVE